MLLHALDASPKLNRRRQDVTWRSKGLPVIFLHLLLDGGGGRARAVHVDHCTKSRPQAVCPRLALRDEPFLIDPASADAAVPQHVYNISEVAPRAAAASARTHTLVSD